jgi:hypothetical protein
MVRSSDSQSNTRTRGGPPVFWQRRPSTGEKFTLVRVNPQNERETPQTARIPATLAGTRGASPEDGETPVTETSIDLRYSDARGEPRVLRATLVDGASWDLSASLEGEIYTRRCHSWQSVERTLFYLRHHHGGGAPAGGRRVAVPLVAIVTLLLSIAGSAVAQPYLPDPAVERFMAATRNYAALHRIIELSVPPIDITSDPAAINRATRQLAAVLRAERQNAKAGDLFTDDVAPVLRARIAEGLADRGLTPGDVLMAEAVEGIDSAGALLRVNGTFPWLYASAMFPCVLQALPELPPELQYRLVGRTLVLVDVHASLIVDLLPNAIGATELR